jgi:transcription antitermination protein NusB
MNGQQSSPPRSGKGHSSKAAIAARNARSAARLAAVQGLYQMDMAATDIDVVIENLASSPILELPDGEILTDAYEPDREFLEQLLRGAVRRQREIDPMVDDQLAAGWRLVRVDSILRAILRAGVIELMDRPDIPARVVICEYVDVAKAFFDADEPKVTNGVLDKLARKLRPKEFENA